MSKTFKILIVSLGLVSVYNNNINAMGTTQENLHCNESKFVPNSLCTNTM